MATDLSDNEQNSEYDESPISYDIPQKKIETKKSPLLTLSKEHPVITVMLSILALVIIILIIVLPLTLVKKKE